LGILADCFSDLREREANLARVDCCRFFFGFVSDADLREFVTPSFLIYRRLCYVIKRKRRADLQK
jgi:hypothetical protein